jgi:hypothetical protein
MAALERFRVESGIPGAPADVAQQGRVRSRLERALPADEFADACARGAQLSIDQAAAMTNDALADVEQLSARAY